MALMAIMENAEGTALRELESLYDATAREIGRKERRYVDHGRSLRSYCASFEKGRRLHVKDGELYYTADGRLRGPLVPSGEPDHFELGKGMMKMTLALERGSNGEIQGLATSRAGSDEWERFKRELAL